MSSITPSPAIDAKIVTPTEPSDTERREEIPEGEVEGKYRNEEHGHTYEIEDARIGHFIGQN